MIILKYLGKVVSWAFAYFLLLTFAFILIRWPDMLGSFLGWSKICIAIVGLTWSCLLLGVLTMGVVAVIRSIGGENE